MAEKSDLSFPDLLNLPQWVSQAESNPQELRRRQVVEVVLNSISKNDTLRTLMLLKGGALMNIAYGSPRATADVDFSTTEKEISNTENYIKLLNEAIPVTLNELGYLDLSCRVQGHNIQPPREDATFPTLELRVGSAGKNQNEIRRYERGEATHVTQFEISFNETVQESQSLRLDKEGNYILAYSVYDLIAEKFRALLQQPIRNRYRRQDVYDISRIIKQQDFSAGEKTKILDALIQTTKNRDVIAGPDSMKDDEVIRRAREDYDTLTLEIDEELNFDNDYQDVSLFYESLPWDKG